MSSIAASSARPAGSAQNTPHATVGAQLHSSPAVRDAVNAIVSEVRARSSQITDVRPPDPALKESYESLMARASAVRGKPLLYPYLGSGVGNGPLVELADGSVKWDMVCGIGVNFFGHSDADLIRQAVLGGLDDVVKQGNLTSNFEAYQFGEVLLREAARHSRLKHAYVATSGAMANENALKVCLHRLYQRHCEGAAANEPAKMLAAYTATPRVIAFRDCFMGRSTTMAQIGDSHAGREGLPNGVHVDYMPFWDAAAAERLGPGTQGKTRFIDDALARMQEYTDRYPGGHACFIFEMVQGEGGFNVGDRDYLKALMEFCKTRKIAVWDDEIQTFGRLPRMFAYEYFDLGDYVDVFCVGKMTQACATLWTTDFNPRTNLLSGTFTGETSSFRVGSRVLERLASEGCYDAGTITNPGPQGAFSRHHAAFRAQCAALIARHPEWFPAVDALGGGGERLAGGLGGMMRFTPFGGDKTKVMNACKSLFDEGVIAFYCGHGPYHVRMLPPLPVMQESHWPRIFACIEKGLARVK
ncbi:MAG: aminotransferase class III-fold pyridoxal phosphate-dependent enzyme [Phycisphaerales bacterium]